MAGKKENIIKEAVSETLLALHPEERAAVQKKIDTMSPEKLKEYLAGIDADSMGFMEEEAPTYED